MDEFKALDPDKDKASNIILLYCEYVIGAIFGLFLIIVAIILPWTWASLLYDHVAPLLLALAIIWVANTERTRRSCWKRLKYVMGDNQIDPDPANCVFGVPGKRPVFSEITGVDLLLYGKATRNFGQVMEYKLNRYFIINWGTVLVPEKGKVMVHTAQKSPAGIGTNSYAFTPEDVDGFISSLKKRIDKNIQVRTMNV
jgi:hypothetical protein